MQKQLKIARLFFSNISLHVKDFFFLFFFFFNFQPPLKKVVQEDLTEENIMSHMPDMSRKRMQEVRY